MWKPIVAVVFLVVYLVVAVHLTVRLLRMKPNRRRAVRSGGPGGERRAAVPEAMACGPGAARPLDNRTMLFSFPSVVFTDAAGLAKTYRLSFGEFLIGSGGGCNLVIRDPGVQSRHARIRMSEEGFAVEGVPGGETMVNGETISGPCPLRDNDRVTVGNTELVFRA